MRLAIGLRVTKGLLELGISNLAQKQIVHTSTYIAWYIVLMSTITNMESYIKPHKRSGMNVN
jgi:hypothetical protein